MLSRERLPELTESLRAAGVDGWLLYDFRGINPVVRRVLDTPGMATRRLFAFIPTDGSEPTVVAHKIELQGLQDFPGRIIPYAAWQELHEALRSIVDGKRVAMEISPNDTVPYLDRIPHGVVQLVEQLGGTVVPSNDLVTRFAARVTPAEMDDHCRAAEIIANIARGTLGTVLHEIGTAREAGVQQRVLNAIERAGLVTTHPPIVAFGKNAANPHYEPHEGADEVLGPDQVVLLDLWGGKSKRSVFADQTWMGFSGHAPPEDVLEVWTTVRDARKAVVSRLETLAPGNSITGAELDDVARALIVQRGYGDAFVHRTGHSIDYDLHGIGPHLDNFETNDVRTLVPGIAFSVEPGVYLEGRFGVRSEINVLMREDGARPTPDVPQEELILQR
jgi:Xaa-Pro aminopeptidase